MSFIINSKRFGGGAVDNLDAYPPQACYGLKYLLSSYTGAVIRVFKESDALERDFTPEEITDGTLEAFAGVASRLRIITMYDQSLNGHDLTNSGPSVNILKNDLAFIHQDRLASVGLATTSVNFQKNGLGSVFTNIRTTDTIGMILSRNTSEFLCVWQENTQSCESNSGTPNYYIDGVEQITPVRQDLSDSISTGNIIPIAILNIDFTTWLSFRWLTFAGASVFSAECEFSYLAVYNGDNDQSANQAEIEAILNNIF